MIYYYKDNFRILINTKIAKIFLGFSNFWPSYSDRWNHWEEILFGMMLTIWPTHPVFLLLFWSFWRSNSNCFIYFWGLSNLYDIRLWEMQLISKWSTYTALISVNFKEELVMFLHFFSHFCTSEVSIEPYLKFPGYLRKRYPG